MTELPGEAVRTLEEAAVDDDPATDPGAEREQHDVVVPPRRADAVLPDDGGRRVVDDADDAAGAERVPQQRGERHLPHADVGAVAQPPLAVDEPGHPEADRQRRTRPFAELLEDGDERTEQRVRVVDLRASPKDRADDARRSDTPRPQVRATDVDADGEHVVPTVRGTGDAHGTLPAATATASSRWSFIACSASMTARR